MLLMRYVNQGWILDGFPVTSNQAQLLEEVLNQLQYKPVYEMEAKKTQTSTVTVILQPQKKYLFPLLHLILSYY